MPVFHVIYNPLSGNGKGKDEALKLKDREEYGQLEFDDITKIGSYKEFFASIPEDDKIVISGGDGTLNRFINDTEGIEIKNEILYYATGSGNDFAHDIGADKDNKPVRINEYLCDLPTVTVKGKSYRFINGVGYGIDGYCCEVGDKLRETTDKPVNYAGIAIKGLLFHFKPADAVVTVDGVRHEYKHVWLAPTMNGRFYGGGMMCAPAQDRLGKDKNVSVVVMFGSGKLKTLAVFPSIFKGEHVKHTEMVAVLTGHDIKVEFSSPCALQVDGETILGVSGYEVHTVKSINAEKEKTAEYAAK